MRRLRKLNERKRRKDKDSYVGGWDIKLPANDIKEKKHTANVSIRKVWFLFNDNLLFQLDELMIKSSNFVLFDG